MTKSFAERFGHKPPNTVDRNGRKPEAGQKANGGGKIPTASVLIRQPLITCFIASILLLQLLGTVGWIGWAPGLFVGGGIDRIVEFAIRQGFEAASIVKLATNACICVYWAVMLLASSGLGADAPPRLVPGEKGWQFGQRRTAYVPPLLLLLGLHLVGALIASTGWWLLALPFEMGGHLGIAALLYVLLIPEGRRRLVIIEDIDGKGLSNRMYVSSGFNAKCRKWLAIRHDHLRGTELCDPLWARLLNTAHLEITYLDNNLAHCSQVIKCIGTKDEMATIVSILNGRFRQGRPLLYTLPPSYANAPQRPARVDEESTTV